METTDKVTEGSPLKSAEDGMDMALPETEIKTKSCKEVLGFSRMTHWRTAMFFFSLFLCLSVVFAFSFIIPCPERPQYNVTWSRDFSEAATYDFLAFELVDSDKVMDVLFVIQSPQTSPNKSCADAGLPSPCLFMLALDGTKGRTLWGKPLNAPYRWAQCGLQRESTPPQSLGESSSITGALRIHFCSPPVCLTCLFSGDVFWQQPQPTGLLSSLPVLRVPDLDGDKVGDVVLTQLVLLSGSSGAQIGSTVVIDAVATRSHLLHCTKGGSHYVLLQTAMTETSCFPLRKPSFGHFNEDNVLDLVVEDDLGNFTKKISILDGRTGVLLWETELLASANSPSPDAVYTTNSVSVFMFWGLVPSESTSRRRAYMLHPHLPNVLLESTNLTVAATLMERGRHAAHFLLTGPEEEGTAGTVVLTKRKLKQDVPTATIRRLDASGEQPSEEKVKETFNRLRFSSDW
uniref:Family with sequence similarity 234 member A n=1 Tax=Fundulus heteroclitus TaxID=8078 RepID=A0A3Q2R234_FUNHE